MADLTVSSLIDGFMQATTRSGMWAVLKSSIQAVNPMAALVIDTTTEFNTKSVSGNVTMTFSGTPPAGSCFGLMVTNTDTDFGYQIVIPTSISTTRFTSTTKVYAQKGSATYLQWRYDGTSYYLTGETIMSQGAAGAADTYSLAIGEDAAVTNAPSYSVNLGYHAGQNAPADGLMVNVGYAAGSNATGYAQTNVGYAAGGSCAGASSVNIGHLAGSSSGGTNVYVGTHAGEAATAVTGGTIGIGYHAGNTASNASNSVFIGDHAASSGCTNGSNSIFIGPFSGIDRPGTLWIDGTATVAQATAPLIYGEFDNRKFTVNGDGLFGRSATNDTSVASAALQVNSTTQGFLPPRLTDSQIGAVATPAEGLVVYNITSHKLNVFTGSGWETVTSI